MNAAGCCFSNRVFPGMISHIRAVIRLLFFAVVTILTVIFVAVGNIILSPFNNIRITWKNRIIQLWARCTELSTGMNLVLEGTPPKPPFFLVCNHLSYIDVVPLWKYLDATFIAKSEVSKWPFFGIATKILGVLFIDRNLKGDVKRVNKLISENISDRQGVILFPEGTSTKGENVLPFNSSLLFYPAVSRIPVHYASITYKTQDNEPPAYLRICWWGDMPFLSHLYSLFKVRAFEAKITFGELPESEGNRKKLAKKLHSKIQQQFEPVIIP